MTEVKQQLPSVPALDRLAELLMLTLSLLCAAEQPKFRLSGQAGAEGRCRCCMMPTLSLFCDAEQSGRSTSGQAGTEGAADAARARRGGYRNPAGSGNAQGRPTAPRKCDQCRLLMLTWACAVTLPCPGAGASTERMPAAQHRTNRLGMHVDSMYMLKHSIIHHPQLTLAWAAQQEDKW